MEINLLITDKIQLEQFKNKYVVYMMLFPNNKKYIGYSSNIIRRWSKQSEYSSQFLVFNAIKKYGWNNIKKYILFYFDDSKEALKKEKELIDKFNLLNQEFGYNMVEGGGDPPHGENQHLSEETKKILAEKRRAAAIKMWQDEDKAEYLKKRMKEEFHKARMNMSEEQRKKSFGEHNIGNIPPNAKAILQIDPTTNEVIAEYRSARQAGLAIGIENSSNIQRTANGIGKTAYGYKWRWKDA